MPESRLEWVVFIVGLAVVAGLVVVAVRARDNVRPAGAALTPPVTHHVATEAPKSSPPPKKQVSTRTRSHPAREARKIVLSISATARTWIEVRTGSSAGALLYSGTLLSGARRTFRSAQPVWVRFGGAASVSVGLDERPLRIPTGTYDAVFSADGFRQVSTS